MRTANFRTLDLNLLRVYDAVVTEGSITRAAERLSMTQPAVSNALKRLRDSLSEDLLTRTPKGVKATPHGQALWVEVRAALAQLRAAIEPDVFVPTQDVVTFQLAMADATAAVMLPPLVARIEAEGALTQLVTVPLLTRDPHHMLEHGDVDFAVGYFPQLMPRLLGDGGDQSVLRSRRLSESRYVCVMRRHHPLAAGELTLEAYCEARHVRVSFSGRGRGLVDQALANLGRSRHIAITVNQFFTAARVVANSDLLTVLPRGFLPVAGYGDRLVACELPFVAGGVHVDAVWHLRNDTRAAHNWLIAHLAAAAEASRVEASLVEERDFGLPLA